MKRMFSRTLGFALLVACTACGGSANKGADPATTTAVAAATTTTTTVSSVRICHSEGRSDLEVHLAAPITDARMNAMLNVITPPTGRGTQDDFLPGFGDLTTDYEDGIVWVQYRDDATDAQHVSARDTVRRSPLVAAVLECTDHPPNSGGPLPTPPTDTSAPTSD